jgi:ketosteroid isomerase-like protein
LIGKEENPMEDTILALEQHAMERWRQGDPGGFVDLSADEITYIDPGLTSPILGREAFTAYMRRLEGKVHYQRSEFIEPRVVVAGEAAVLSYNYLSSVVGPEGAVVSQTPWNATEVYFQQQGQWKIAHTHWSYLQHQLPAAVEMPLPVRMSPHEYEGVLREVMALESTAMERWRQGDPWGFIEISAPEVTYFDTGTPQRINGREALSAEYTRREGKISYEVMDFVEPRVQVCGDLAVLTYRFLSTRLNPAGAVTYRTPWNCTEVFRRLEGHWKIIHTHWSFIRGERP